jgi:hypothetical protein
MTSLNTFATKLLQVIQHTNHNSAGETHWSQVQTRCSIDLYGQIQCVNNTFYK